VRRFAIFLVIALIVGGIAATLISRDPGYVLIAYDGLSLETSLWFALVAGVSIFAVLKLLSAMLRRVSRTGAAMRVAREARRVREAREQTVRGLLALVERDWAAARNALLGAAPHAELPLVNYVGAAQAAANLGEHDASTALVQSAVESTPGSAIGVGLIAAAIDASAGRATQARERLEALHKEAPRNVEVSRRLAAVLRDASDWPALAALADELAKQKGFAEAEATRLEIDAWSGRFDAAKADDLAVASASVPKALRDEPEVVASMAGALMRTGANDEAADALERGLDKGWTAQLVELYGRVASARPAARLARAERWLPSHASDGGLLTALGRLAVCANEPEKARGYFEAALRVEPSATVYAELGRLWAAQGDTARAAEYRSHALELAGIALPALATAEPPRGAPAR